MAQDPEPPLDLIEPGRIGGREVQVKAGVTHQPRAGLGMLVRTVVINHEMHFEFGRDIGIDLLQEAKELLMSVPCPALGQDPAVGDIESGEQGRGAMALVVVRETVGIAETHRQHWLRSFQRLNFALLIDAEDHGMVRRIEV